MKKKKSVDADQSRGDDPTAGSGDCDDDDQEGSVSRNEKNPD